MCVCVCVCVCVFVCVCVCGVCTDHCFVYPSPGVCHLASHLTSLVRLDLSGCMNITTKSLEALQESLLYARENKTHFNLLVGGLLLYPADTNTHTHTPILISIPVFLPLLGTLIGVKPACQFAAATGASVCHHDMSIPSLAADYDPFLDMR